MIANLDEIISVEQPIGRTHGFFKRGATEGREDKPLIVLIHGGGTNAFYFDNHLHSVPADFSQLGYDVLNINRPGFGGNPVLKSDTPVFDCIPLLSELIKKVYQGLSSGNGGVVLIGHSLGAAISLILAVQNPDSLPILGVSALGIVPTNRPNQTLLGNVLKSPPGERVPAQPPSEDNLLRFMGYPDYVDDAIFGYDLKPIFETSVRSELLEWFDVQTYNRFVTEIMPAVRVPLQYLAAEVELGWIGAKQGRPIFDAAAKLFVNAPRLEAELLLDGAHNFEFSKNSRALRERRIHFVDSLAGPRS